MISVADDHFVVPERCSGLDEMGRRGEGALGRKNDTEDMDNSQLK
jgi:hypothetical protein